MNKKNIVLIYLYGFFSSFLLYRSCDTLYYLEKGVSSSGYLLFIVITYLISLLLQIPSGILADKYNKKKILFATQILLLISILLFIKADSYLLLVLAIIVQAVQETFVTGMDNTIIYQSLNDKEKFSKSLFYKSIFNYSGYILAMILGGIVGSYSLVSMYYVSLIPVLINFAVIGLLNTKELPQTKLENKKAILRDAITIVSKNKLIISMFLISGFCYSVATIVAESHPEYATNVGLSPFIIGIYTAIMCLIAILGSYISSKHKSKIKDLILVPFFLALSVFTIGVLNNPFGIIFVLTMQFCFSIYSNSMTTVLHSQISDNSRATVESILSVVTSLFGIVLGLLTSFTSKYFSIENIYIILGIITIIYISLVMIWSKVKKVYQIKSN